VLAQKLAPGSLHLYIDCGTEDELMFHHSVQDQHDVLLDRGIKHEYFLGHGHHTLEFWKTRPARQAREAELARLKPVAGRRPPVAVRRERDRGAVAPMSWQLLPGASIDR